MSNFKDYIKNKNTSPEEKIKEYSGKSESELYAELISLASKGKEDGTLNEKSINDFQEKISPVLNEEQREKLQEILNKLRSV